MRHAYDVATVRAAEQVLLDRLPEGALMQRAATGLATVCAELLGRVYGARVTLLVGSGNNGGDALFAGARLARRGARVDAVLVGTNAHDTGLEALRRAGGRIVDTVHDDSDLVVDGILGIGGRGGLRDRAATVVDGLPAGAWVVAVDVPSGVDASTGEVEGPAVRADVTVTFGALKPGLLVDPGAGHAGVVELVDIGLEMPTGQVEVLQADDVARLLPRADRESDKYRRGVVGVAAGSDQYTGAAVLCAGGAVRGGAGMVRYVGAEAPTGLVRQHWPEVVVGAGRVQAWAVGSGGGGDAAARLKRAAEDGVPVVVDADALTELDQLDQLGDRPPMLLTPHAGELARLLGADRDDVEARRLHHARAAAREHDAVVLLKGSTTVVAHPDGRTRVNPTGTPALATAGSGDVLAGLCGALLAGGLDPFDAGSAGAWLHGLAGRLAAESGSPVSAADVLAALPRAVAATAGD